MIEQLSLWGQGTGYNLFMPPRGCDCGRALAGCGPVALAQIMRYYRFPSVATAPLWAPPVIVPVATMPVPLDYNQMPQESFAGCDNPTNGESQVQALIAACGLWSDTQYKLVV